MPTDSFTARAVAAVDRATAWTGLQRPETWAAIGGVDEVRDARHDPDGLLLGFSVSAIVGGRRYPGTARTVASDPRDSMTVEVTTSELRGHIEVLLSEAPAGTMVTARLTLSSRGFLGSMLFPVISSAVGSGIEASVSDFAAGLERD